MFRKLTVWGAANGSAGVSGTEKKQTGRANAQMIHTCYAATKGLLDSWPDGHGMHIVTKIKVTHKNQNGTKQKLLLSLKLYFDGHVVSRT